MGTDKLLLAGMEFYVYHGVLPEEKVLGQTFIVDAEIWLDLSSAGETDDLNQTISYADVFNIIKGIVTNKRFNLLEALAEDIAGQILNMYKIDGIRVRVRKPGAPINGTFEYMGCEITRYKRSEASRE